MKTKKILLTVRRRLGQIPFTSEDVKADNKVIYSPTTSFSDDDLIRRINTGQNTIIGYVKGQHVPNLVLEYQGLLPYLDNTVLRVLRSQVYRNNKRCYHRDYESYINLVSSNRGANENKPVYSLNDNRIDIYPEGGDILIYILRKPQEVFLEDDNLEIDLRLKEALVYNVLSSCYATLDKEIVSKYYWNSMIRELEPFFRSNVYSRLIEKETDTI